MSNGYIRKVHGPPGPPGSLPQWATGPALVTCEPETEAAFVSLDEVPGLVVQAFAEAGVEVEAQWKTEPQALPPVVDEWDSAVPVEQIQPCRVCGSLELWWDFSNGQHCMQCEPWSEAKARRLIRKAKRNRLKADRRHGLIQEVA